jgi:hypothetical protein
MDDLVAALHGGEDIVPLAFDIRAVCVEMGIESRLFEYFLAGGDIGGDRDAHTEGDNGEIGNDMHGDYTDDDWIAQML